MTAGYKKAKIYLSKSLFIRGLQCPKSLYLHKYHPELKDETSAEQERLFQVGFEVGEYARRLFPGGVESPYEEDGYAGQVEKTKAEIDKGSKIIYEAAFNYADVFVKVDILHKGKRGWEIYEVKSSTKVEDVHINDTAIQYFVLKGAGLKIAKAAVVHINTQYVRNDEIEPNKLFAIEDITDAVKDKRPFIAAHIAMFQEMLKKSEIPAIDIGNRCYDPYPCDFQGHCWQHIPADSVFDLKGKGVDKFAMYRQGVVVMKDIPLDILNEKQRMQVEAFVGKKEFIDKTAIKFFLKTLRYPMYFLDFETFYTPIPLFDGVKPYQQVPFQFSLHWREKEGAELKHTEFIVADGSDPRKGLILKLLDSIPEKGCIVVYTGFESGRLRDLAAQFPEYRGKLEHLITNIRDLSMPFKRMDYYHWQMAGSYSIKTVLPTLIPDLSYDGMEISDGGMAMDAYFAMNDSKDHAEIEKIRRALLEYCRLDTLAMVRLHEKLRAICY